MIGSEDTLINTILVSAAVVFVVTDEDVEFVVQRDVVDIAQAAGVEIKSQKALCALWERMPESGRRHRRCE